MATITLYNSFFNDIQNGRINLLSDQINVTLHTSSYTPSLDHEDYADVDNELPTANGYTAGGRALTGKTVGTVDDGVFDADNVSWADSTLTARYGILRKYDATPANSYLIGYIDFLEDKVSSAGTFPITWSDSGILKLQAAS